MITGTEGAGSGAGTSRAGNITSSDLENWFRYKPPTAEELPRCERLLRAGKELANQIVQCTPPGPEQMGAIREVREIVAVSIQNIVNAG